MRKPAVLTNKPQNKQHFMKKKHPCYNIFKEEV